MAANDDPACATTHGIFLEQRRAFDRERAPPLAVRLDRLARLRALTDALAPELAQAISADFGHRSIHETRLAETMVVGRAIDHAQRHLRRWMRARRVATPLVLQPGSSRLQPQPLGVVGVMSPWNYPFQLSIGPAVSALAAGNRAMIKPSDGTPRFSALLQRAVAERFAADELAVIPGDLALSRRFAALPFDHLLFTGSTAVGRQVAVAAAANLTPVTLELGGKSPAIVDVDCDLDRALPRLMAAKLLNAGQTCIAPDYLLVHTSLMHDFADRLKQATQRLYPTIADNPDYSCVIDRRRLDRLLALLDDARTQGGEIVPLHAETEARHGKLPPFAIFHTVDAMRVMRDEIFGPLLPVVVYQHLDEAIAYVNARERPLALYWFGRDRANREAVLAGTVSGGVTINDCLFHVAQDALPFGGVGASGHGRYHGESGFRTFTHDKPVFVQSRWSGTGMMSPPYGRTFDRLAGWMRRLR